MHTNILPSHTTSMRRGCVVFCCFLSACFFGEGLRMLPERYPQEPIAMISEVSIANGQTSAMSEREARVLLTFRELRMSANHCRRRGRSEGNIRSPSPIKRDCHTNYLVQQPLLFLYNPGAPDLHGSRKQSGDQRYTVLRK